jgi:long-chain acyl-CoA synthetase
MDPMAEPTIAEVHAQLTAPGERCEMEEVVIRGVPTRVWKHAPPSLAFIVELSRGYGDLDFLVYEDERWTFARHADTVAQFAHRLRDQYGVEKGDRVAIAMRNFPEWSVAFWGASAAGAIVVPLNAWWTAPELAYGIRDSGSNVIVCDLERLERVDPSAARVIVARSEGAPLPSGVDRFEDVVGEFDGPVALPAVDFDPEDEATIFYTSGTTGDPKGVLGTQRNICGNLISLAFTNARSVLRTKAAEAPELPPPDRNAYLLSVPFFHATGCHSVLVANLTAGNKLVLMHKWDAGRALELIEREQVTIFGGVPAMVWQVLEHPDFASRDLSSVRSIGYGGAPAAPELVRRIEAMFPGRSPSNGYGLTETSSVTTMNAGIDYVRHPDSVGVPVPVCDVKVVDADGNSLPNGEVGEVWIKGPNVVMGYWNKPVETAASFSDGWLHSGDLGRIDDEGFVYIVDRAKDLIIRGGENIASIEVESALFEHPAVTDAAVIGIPHPVLGEEVGAVVHLGPGTSATEDELRAHVAERIAAFKVPVRIWFLDDPLPRNPNGKIMKRELREQVLTEA